MRVWVDADACPGVIRDILCRAAERTRVTVTFVANQPVHTRPSRFVRTLQVQAGFDVTDNEIVKRMAPGDLVITSDIPLAAEAIEKGGTALSARGELFSPDTTRERLNMRDFMDTMRASGIQTGGPPPLSQSDRHAFARHLDGFLAKHAADG